MSENVRYPKDFRDYMKARHGFTVPNIAEDHPARDLLDALFMEGREVMSARVRLAGSIRHETQELGYIAKSLADYGQLYDPLSGAPQVSPRSGVRAIDERERFITSLCRAIERLSL